jgi:LmbE family N-acetylglucosaminyl deacetylase
VPDSRPIFLSPHYDDAELSCGGTLAMMADAGEHPLVITIFGGEPSGPLNSFAQEMHQAWGLAPEDVIAHRRSEEACAAAALGVESRWLELPDAIYRGERYLCDDHLFGAIHPQEATFHKEIRTALFELLSELDIEPTEFYCPIGIGNHVDHQHVLAMARTLTFRGYAVQAWEDFPYAGDPGVDVVPMATTRATGEPVVRELTEDALERKIEAINCYQSQHSVIFRLQGDPEAATRAYAERVGGGTPAERLWPLTRG